MARIIFLYKNGTKTEIEKNSIEFTEFNYVKFCQIRTPVRKIIVHFDDETN